MEGEGEIASRGSRALSFARTRGRLSPDHDIFHDTEGNTMNHNNGGNFFVSICLGYYTFSLLQGKYCIKLVNNVVFLLVVIDSSGVNNAGNTKNSVVNRIST